MKEKRNIKAKAAGIVVCVLLIATSVIIANRSAADWQEGNDYKMHFPQLPDLYGWDVNATWPLVVADDWMCTATGYVSDIHFWGSWRNDTIGTINSFWIGIYSDVPSNQTMYSHPGELLWSRWFHPDEWIEVANETPQYTEGWYDPHTGKWWKPNHWMYFQYNIANITDPFVQWNGTIYWLAISANVTGGYWGWKTSQNHWTDDAVWSWIDEIYWTDLWDPQEGISLDMAFVITGEEFPCCNKDWDYWTNPPHMWMIPSGNVGIGTRHPQAKLHVNGGMRVDGSTQPYLFFVNANTGKIGIGTNNPQAKLHVNGSIRSSGNINMDTVRWCGIFNTQSDRGLTFSGGSSALDGARYQAYGGTHPIYPGLCLFDFGSQANDITSDTSFRMRFRSASGGVTDIFYCTGRYDTVAGKNIVSFVHYNGNVTFNEFGKNYDFRVESDNNPNMLFVDASTDRVGIGTNNPNATLDVEGYVQAYGYYTGDIFFQKDGKKLWRMFEDENGLYVEDLTTGKIYTIVSRNGNAHANNIGFYMITIGIGAIIGAAIAIAWRRRN